MTTRVQPLRGVPDAPPPAPVPLRPPRRRRSKLLVLLGLVLSALSAAGVVWVFRATDEAVAAVGVARPVRYGEVITADALREVQVRPDPGVRPLPWDRRFDVVGRTSPTDLQPGEIVTPDAVTDPAIVPGAGQQLIGVPVKPGQLPAAPLQPRQPILLVPAGVAGTAAEAWAPVRGAVISVSDRDATSTQVIDVVVPEANGVQLASRASAGGVAIVVLPKDR
ncbi:SAF domain-containing protein [Amycolatopsis mediterranei S699]|uniref:SAF domain-containing protein n=2 Tax=Amycolatopsis mediterranei TaxID=33910 RepID=A0A0H3DDQ1_AMYMU|nr:SAF domain-containing protein [Amycolatopsis mediterranei]ADJ48816.1 SAF domain-containing protein [Amycolatopsis mediterranei U32]AEK45756.1 SAF domain-containing protein [Amycolatopsis mediterranei S699]AFO80525.1 SAF domain-containing protein [Amycolatopsis mediterranei S699]AGT87653.1 SAF domain-containing protein [Amycolatopsis mediterranei RB]KDU94075.1 flagellar basal body P-ring biosynthesis protein FlgA [Amycolatopsis mediterranei]